MMTNRPHAKVVLKGLGQEMNILFEVLKIKSIYTSCAVDFKII
jgi:hypothetical protein